MRYSYEQFVKDAEMAVEYGIPADKLVLGVPFIGTTGVNGEQVSYSDFIMVDFRMLLWMNLRIMAKRILLMVRIRFVKSEVCL